MGERPHEQTAGATSVWAEVAKQRGFGRSGARDYHGGASQESAIAVVNATRENGTTRRKRNESGSGRGGGRNGGGGGGDDDGTEKKIESGSVESRIDCDGGYDNGSYASENDGEKSHHGGEGSTQAKLGS
jgi:hypothetical protein